jgi:ribonuclease BN (tRNA processing enzyme)
MSELTFIGTAGGRYVVTSQLRKSGGMWLQLGGVNMLIDPGPGSLVRCIELGLNPSKLDAIILSHRHIDHSNDVNIMIEAMSGGGFRPRGALIAPADCLEGEDRVVLRYVRSYIKNKIYTMKDGFSLILGDTTISAAVKMSHSDVECYGMKFSCNGHTLGYSPDTKYFDGLPEAFKGCDHLIVNMVRMTHDARFQHLTPPDVTALLKIAKPGTALLSHFGMQIVKASPPVVAAKIQKETGIRTIAAEDGMKVALDYEADKKNLTLSDFV